MASLLPRSGTLGIRLAKHLLRRSTYNISRQRIDQFSMLTTSQALDLLMAIPANPTLPEPIDPETGEHWINLGIPPTSQDDPLRDYVKAWWMDEARQDESIGHKMSFFLHSNFITNFTNYTSESAFDYIAFLEYYALGNFKTLALKMVTDNLMLRYLNGDQNTKWNPNENFGREFLELFTIGKGPQIGPGDYTHYTELDIQAAAKLLTGFKKGDRAINIDADTGIPTGYANFNHHNVDDKQFSSAFQDTLITGATTEAEMWGEVTEFVDMIFNQDETAKNICRKLYRYFVGREINTEIDSDIIEPLATTLRNNDYNLGIVVRILLESEHFYDEDDASSSDEIIGNMIKSPLEMALGTFNLLDLSIPDPVSESLNHYRNFYRWGVAEVMLEYAGQNIFAPTTVAGYPAYYQGSEYHRNWFNSSTIIPRYKLPQMLLESRRVLTWGGLGGVQLNMVSWVENPANISDPSDAVLLVSEMLTYFFPEQPSAEREEYFLTVFLEGLNPLAWYYEWIAYVASGDDSEVKIPLGHLIKAILYSQEYQML